MLFDNNLSSYNRYQAFGIHLLSSIVIATLSATLVYLIWYPAPLATATGVTDIFLLLLAVDTSLGPLLTLVVFNPQKKELKWDLTVIATLQIIALLYGLNTVFIARPVYEVFNKDRFDLVYANDLTEEKLVKVKNQTFKQPPLFGPEVIAAQMPSESAEQNKILFSALAGGDDLPQIPEYYVTYSEQKNAVIEHAQPLEKLNAFNPEEKNQIFDLTKKYSSNGVGFLPLKAKTQDMSVIIDKNTAEVLEVVNLRPWKS